MSSTTGGEPGPASGRRPLSLAFRLTLWYSVSTFVFLLAASFYLYWALADNLEREDDEFLADQIHILRGLLKEQSEKAGAIEQEIEVESGLRRHARFFLRLLDPEGRTLTQTSGMPEELRPGSFPTPATGDPDLDTATTLETASGQSYRLMAAEAEADASRGPRVIQAALDRGEEEELLAAFRAGAIPFLALCLLASTWVGHRIARSGIRPLVTITETARRIRSTSLGERINPTRLPAELSALAETFNDMLARLEESFERLLRFSADIAHELRTPVQNLRGEMEVALGRARTAEEYRTTVESCIEEATRLGMIVESLLFLARAENPGVELSRETVDLSAELTRLREFYQPTADEAGIGLSLRCPDGLTAPLDRTLLQRAVGNLLENALTHTSKGASISIEAGRNGSRIRLEVADTGRGIPEAHLPRVFDRFYRADGSRTSTTGGSGLGLAIVRSIARLHGGEARIESREGVGTRVTLEFPDPPPGSGMTKP